MQRAVVVGIFALALIGLGATACMHPYSEAPEEHTSDEIARGGAAPNNPSDASAPKATTQPTTTDDGGVGAITTTAKPGATIVHDAGASTMDAGSCVGTPTAGGDAYVVPRPRQAGACTNADIAFYDALLSVQGETYKSIRASMQTRSPTCAACMFSAFKDTSWGPIVMLDDTNGFFDWGACYTYAKDGSPGCGSQAQQWFDCLNDVCASCTSDADLAACQNQAAGDPRLCASLPMDLCGTTANLDNLNAQCSTMASAIASACE